MKAFAIALSLLFACCTVSARAEASVYTPPPCLDMSSAASEEDLLRCYAPVWIAPETEASYNRIGSPELYRGWLGGTKARVDTKRATMYGEIRRDQIGDSAILQLVYRIHFEKIPLRFSRYFFEAHRNAGLLVVVTLDEQSRRPLFLTAVHSCGCYRYTLPTDHLERSQLPEEWPDEIRIFSQHLPGVLAVAGKKGARPVISLAPTSHRVTDLDFSSQLPEGGAVELPLIPMDSLRNLPIEGDREGRRGSFFYSSGPLRGHVRGAWNPMEGLTLFGLLSLDPTVGMDKDFGDPEVTGTTFYTSLPFWKHQRSRLDRFDSILRDLGFRMSATETEMAE
ncbi:MAG: hypothetical protein GY725_17745 [bacterium]|nr:hypothetical protein [bacterium]